ncbi:MAG: YebC/PmpR family DNA-binding transcriptional regulator [Verrucomicrobiota bacterium]|nr:YebC/PmpR family DNA-binding transcriptional regulator [Verrucomicrobiota bacterium]
MAGHSKWANIKHKKGAADARRGKIFSKLSKEITSATRSGLPDPDANARLRSAIAAAKSENMPNDNIDRAIKKGTGELGGGRLDEVAYEGYAQGGVGIVVDCLTDNRNRTASNIRSLFTKVGSSLAETGAVSHCFERKARFVVKGENAVEDKLLEILLEADIDVDDVDIDDGIAEIIAPAQEFDKVVTALEKNKIIVAESELTKIASILIPVTDTGSLKSITNLIDQLEDDEDVEKVYTNMDISDELMEEFAKDN